MSFSAPKSVRKCTEDERTEGLICYLVSIVILVSLTASFSPLSSNIYYPALDLIADDLQTSNSTFALSVSIYM